MDRNPYWYKFTCYSAGTLGFVITPVDLTEDFDWHLFDITGQNPDDVFTNPALSVSCNWSGETGITGSSASGTSTYVCGGLGKPLFSSMAVLQQGHEYLLMVSHYKNSPNGYTLEFKGGTAQLYDPLEPGLTNVTVNCQASTLTIKLNKKLLCSSVAPGGSDFSISASGISIVSATGNGCTGFDTDTVSLLLSGPLVPGNYTLNCITGLDGNTLLDNCNRGIPVGANLTFTVPPVVYAYIDSVMKPGCAPQTLNVFLSSPANCSSIATDGSDFAVVGPQAITVTGASGICTGQLTQNIVLNLSGAVIKGGAYMVSLKKGTDGNTILNECGFETPAGSSVSFSTGDTVSALFSYKLSPGCKNDTINFLTTSSFGINVWKWNFDNASYSDLQSPVKIYNSTGPHYTQLIVSNDYCADSVSTPFNLPPKLKADFEVKSIFCPDDSVSFKNKSEGLADGWRWNFGDNNTSNLESPPVQYYPKTGQDMVYRTSLTIFDNAGCSDSISKPIKILSNCRIAVPSGFTPNHDGLNDYLYPLNAFNATDLNFKVFNRWGQLVFATNDWQRKWDGTLNGKQQPGGIYVWILQFTNPDTGKKTQMKGTTMLIR